MHHKTRNTITKMQALLLSIILFIGLLPHVTVFAAGGQTHEFNSGAVVIDSSYNGDTVIIRNGVFSVTVIGATDVNIRFVDVTINRYHDENSNNEDALDDTVVSGLYAASRKLPGNTGNTTKALVCPFYITANSTVTAGFTGNCTFFAGTNASTVTANDTYNAVDSGGGYAGIQVDEGSSLTITDAENLKVFGAHQIAFPDLPLPANPNDPVTITVNNKKYTYSDVLRANKTITNVYTDPYTDAYYTGPTGTQFSQSGGAGIGGGVSCTDTSSSGSSYTNGTPGTIIINGVKFETFGGYAAAGIGGGVNGAATNSEIVINGGTIIAHGGRFAAGIGDGDSVTSNNVANTFHTVEGRIEINGGTVTAYGGVASAGIGCTDDMSSNQGSGEKSKLEIAINGGVVRAYSGFPKEFTGTSPDGSPAAIGAGSVSQMESNSIYISSESDLLCAGFGEYSLTEDGRKSGTQAAPVINVDSDGYLLLLKTGNYVSTAERTLKMWLPQTETITVSGVERVATKYINQHTDVVYYKYVDEEQNTIVVTKQQNGSYKQATDEELKEGLTLFVDGNSEPALDPDGKPIEINLAYYFQSMAITLPDPEDQGGLYAITVPTVGITGNGVTIPGGGADIILTVEAHQQGTQSGTIKYPSDHNLELGNTAYKFTDLDVYTDDSTLPTNGLIGEEFLPGVFAYTVYVEPNVDKVYLHAEYDNKNGTTYKVTLDGESLTQTPINSNTAYRVNSPITLTGTTTTVRLRKQDGDNSVGAITYKVTIIKKTEYGLELSDPSKTYDGTPAVSVPESVGEYVPIGILVDEPGANSTTEWLKNTSSGTTNSMVYVNRTGYSFFGYTYYIAGLEMMWQAVPVSNENAVYYVVTVTTSQSSGTITGTDTWSGGWKVTYNANNNNTTVSRLSSKPNDVNATGTWVSNTSPTIATGSNTNLTLTFTTGGAAQIKRGSDNAITIFSVGSAERPSTSNTTVSRDTQEAKAEQAILGGALSGTYPYGTYSETSIKQNMSITTVTNNGSQNNNSNTSSTETQFDVYYSANYSGGAWKINEGSQLVPSALPEGDLEKVVITYRQTHDAEGNTITTTEPTTTPPTDAGKYIATAELRTQTYNASGSVTFTISRREVRVQQIEKWLTYLTSTPADKNATLVITDPGDIILENVVSADMADVSLQVDIKGGNVYYRNSLLNYESEKIALKGASLDGERAFNYTLFYDDASNQLIYVFGQIALDISGSTFRKTATGNWEKYYPEPDGAAVGTSGNPPDYHSPSSAVNGGDVVEYRIHSEYVRARTVNDGSGARYAVDIEYGDMHFGYYRGVWDVSSLSYVDLPESFWGGMDGSNNRIVLNNYSNAEVYYSISANIYPYYGQIDATRGIRAWIAPNTNGTGEMDTWTSVAAATPGDSSNTGSKTSSQCFLFLAGVPQMPESVITEVGTITVTLTQNPPGSS